MKSEQFLVQAAWEDRHWWHVGKRLLHAIIRSAVPPSPDRLIVEVGCGVGGNLADNARDYSCVGLDASAVAVAMARERFPGLRFVQGSAPQALGGDAARADLFLLADVLEHVENDRTFFGEWYAAASPGAFFS